MSIRAFYPDAAESSIDLDYQYESYIGKSGGHHIGPSNFAFSAIMLAHSNKYIEYSGSLHMSDGSTRYHFSGVLGNHFEIFDIAGEDLTWLMANLDDPTAIQSKIISDNKPEIGLAYAVTQGVDPAQLGSMANNVSLVESRDDIDAHYWVVPDSEDPTKMIQLLVPGATDYEQAVAWLTAQNANRLPNASISNSWFEAELLTDVAAAGFPARKKLPVFISHSSASLDIATRELPTLLQAQTSAMESAQQQHQDYVKRVQNAYRGIAPEGMSIAKEDGIFITFALVDDPNKSLTLRKADIAMLHDNIGADDPNTLTNIIIGNDHRYPYDHGGVGLAHALFQGAEFNALNDYLDLGVSISSFSQHRWAIVPGDQAGEVRHLVWPAGYSAQALSHQATDFSGSTMEDIGKGWHVKTVIRNEYGVPYSPRYRHFIFTGPSEQPSTSSATIGKKMFNLAQGLSEHARLDTRAEEAREDEVFKHNLWKNEGIAERIFNLWTLPATIVVAAPEAIAMIGREIAEATASVVARKAAGEAVEGFEGMAVEQIEAKSSEIVTELAKRQVARTANILTSAGIDLANISKAALRDITGTGPKFTQSLESIVDTFYAEEGVVQSVDESVETVAYASGTTPFGIQTVVEDLGTVEHAVFIVGEGEGELTVAVQEQAAAQKQRYMALRERESEIREGVVALQPKLAKAHAADVEIDTQIAELDKEYAKANKEWSKTKGKIKKLSAQSPDSPELVDLKKTAEQQKNTVESKKLEIKTLKGARSAQVVHNDIRQLTDELSSVSNEVKNLKREWAITEFEIYKKQFTALKLSPSQEATVAELRASGAEVRERELIGVTTMQHPVEGISADICLELGNTGGTAGQRLGHLLLRHGAEISEQLGVEMSEIPALLMETVESGTPVSRGESLLVFNIEHEGEQHFLGIVIGSSNKNRGNIITAQVFNAVDKGWIPFFDAVSDAVSDAVNEPSYTLRFGSDGAGPSNYYEGSRELDDIRAFQSDISAAFKGKAPM